MSLMQYVQHLETVIEDEADAQRKGLLVAYKRHVEIAAEETHALQVEVSV
ncbi:MAG TPA: hypothetical protein V6D00_05135 [Pantanalinema sp.]